jgi:hypothetical protein
LNPFDLARKELNGAMIRRSSDLIGDLLDVGYGIKPYDYPRYSSFGLRALLEKYRFVISIQEKLGSNATILFQLTNVYLFKVFQSWPRSMQHLFTMTVIASINFVGVVAGRVFSANPDLFLDHVVLARKVA